MKLKKSIITAIIGLSAILLSCDTVFNDVYEETGRAMIIVAGSFSSIGGDARSNIAFFDEKSGSLTDIQVTGLPALDLNSNIIVLGNTIYISCTGGIYEIDKSTGNSKIIQPINATALGVDEDYIYISGSFTLIDGQTRNNFAVFNRKTGALESCAPDLNGNVASSIVIYGDTVYIGGQFGTVNGQTRICLAAFNRKTGILTSWNPGASGGSTTVSKMIISGTTLYLGGTFDTVAGQSRLNAAAFNLTDGSLLPWNPGASVSLREIAVTNDKVYLSSSNSTEFRAVDKITGNSLPWNPTVNERVFSIAEYNGKIYMGGGFSIVNTQTRVYCAAVSSDTGRLLEWNPSTTGTVVFRIAVIE